ncbi:MAG: hypothetical protein WC881_01975 [Elusimicrobiota bacterium]|jgi:hypothetical protein
MATFYRKRRKNQGPNKNEEKVQRAADARNRDNSSGSLGTRFPTVKKLKIQLQFLSAQSQVLDEKTLDLGPSDNCKFDVPCPGRCGAGVFDLYTAVLQAVRNRQPLAENSAPCAEPSYPGSREACGCKVTCRMELEYNPEAAPAPGPEPAG